jgi:hypothetical protein
MNLPRCFVVIVIAVWMLSSASFAAELWTFYFVADGSLPFNADCGECGPPYLGARADVAGTFTILLDWENGTGKVTELNDQLVNYHDELRTGSGTELRLADPPTRSHGIVPSRYTFHAAPGQFTYQAGVGRLISDGQIFLPGGVYTMGEPYDITFNQHQATFNMDVPIDDWYITVRNAPAVFSNAKMAGDYNNDAHIDASDYVAWRKTSHSPSHYGYWRAYFGSSAATASFSGTAPEPSPIILISATLLPLAVRRRKLRRRPS